MAVRREFDGEVTRSARVEEDALCVLPTGFRGPLTEVGEELIQISWIELFRSKSSGLECLRVEFRIEDDCAPLTLETHIGLHARHERCRIRVRVDE